MDLQKKIEAALEEAINNPTKENLDFYKNLVEMQKVADSQREVKAPVEEKKMDNRLAKYDESSRQWAMKCMDAIAVGATYTSVIPAEISAQVVYKMNEFGKIAARCSQHMVSGSYTFTVEGTQASVAYTAEAGAFTETTPTLSPITLNAYKLAALVKLSREVVADPVVDFIVYVTNSLAKGFAEKIEDEILNGSGSSNSHMTGILTALKAESDTPQIVTDSTALGAFTWANLKKTMQKIGPYRAGAVLIMTQETCDYIHEFKDNSKYIFDQNQPLEAIWGMPILISNKSEAYGTDTKCPVIVANLEYYHMAIRQDADVRVLNELYAANGQVGIVSDMRVDGKPALNAAFAALKTDF